MNEKIPPLQQFYKRQSINPINLLTTSLANFSLYYQLQLFHN